MDSLITAAARSLAAGNPVEALNRIALRTDAAALALRGVAMAQLGEHDRARLLLRRAARTFTSREVVERARCVVAECEIALASRDLNWRPGALDAARALLERHGDETNAAHARHLAARRQLLIGHLDHAERMLHEAQPERLPPALRAAHELMVAGIALRRIQSRPAREALERAARAARQADIPALSAEVDGARRLLEHPAGRLIGRDGERFLPLSEIEALLNSTALVVDAIRGGIRRAHTQVSLARRPVLFALARALAEAWPGDASRTTLIARAFRGRRADESHRARLRVEVGRLRRLLAGLANISATERGFALRALRSPRVVVLARPADERHGALLALLGDGESWSSSALSLALGVSQRSVQRALDALVEAGKVHHFGRGRARRWLLPTLPGFATTLLLPAPAAG